MVRKDDLVEVLTYSAKYGALKRRAKEYLQEQGQDDSDEAVVDIICEKSLQLYHHAPGSMKEGFDSNPENLIAMISRNVDINFPLNSNSSGSGSGTSTSSGGCYVATAVYGSYDCPQVWTLRRYRDNTLGATWYGRLFIRTYYAISPTLVKWFGHTKWFKNFWKVKLDRMVADLQAKGIESTPYDDREW